MIKLSWLPIDFIWLNIRAVRNQRCSLGEKVEMTPSLFSSPPFWELQFYLHLIPRNILLITYWLPNFLNFLHEDLYVRHWVRLSDAFFKLYLVVLSCRCELGLKDLQYDTTYERSLGLTDTAGAIKLLVTMQLNRPTTYEPVMAPADLTAKYVILITCTYLCSLAYFLYPSLYEWLVDSGCMCCQYCYLSSWHITMLFQMFLPVHGTEQKLSALLLALK